MTDDATGTITFHLVAPDPEFLYKLTLNFAYPVPSSTPEENQRLQGVPGTGPYMLEAPMTDEGEVALVRNPEFRVWSQAAQPHGYVDRIEWTSGVEPQAQVDAVAAGDADLALDADLSGSLDELLVKYSAQVHTSPEPVTFFIVLDNKSPPFDNAEVRKAMSLAIDRDTVVQVFGGEKAALPTCQQLPPNFPGTSPTVRTRWNPDRRGRGQLRISKRQRDLFVVRARPGCGSCWSTPHSGVLQGQCSWGPHRSGCSMSLDIAASVRPIPITEFYDAANKFQMAFDAWGADYPAASNFITNRFPCDSPYVPSARVLRPADRCHDRSRDPVAARDQAELARSGRRSITRSSTRLRTCGSSTRSTSSWSPSAWELPVQPPVAGLLNQFWVR